MPETSTQWTNPEILRWARVRLRMMPNDVAQEAHQLQSHLYAPVSASDLERWETGRGEPDLEHLETLSEIYRCPVGYFFLDRVPEQASLPYSFRGLAKEESALSADTHRSLLRFQELAEWTVDFMRRSNISWHSAIRPRIHSPTMGAFEEVARAERERFNWSSEVRRSLSGDRSKAFDWWRRAIENLGVFCFELKLEPSEVRGAALWLDSCPFILVNHRDSEAIAGRLFTLLHEYIHLISEDEHEALLCDFRGLPTGHNPEPFANRVAARMLLDLDELEERLRELDLRQLREAWSDRVLDAIRDPFPVSRDVVLIGLQELGLARTDSYEEKRQQWESRPPWGRARGGHRVTKKERKRRELGFSLSRVLASSRDRADLPWADISYFLDMKVKKAEEFLEWVAGEGSP